MLVKTQKRRSEKNVRFLKKMSSFTNTNTNNQLINGLLRFEDLDFIDQAIETRFSSWYDENQDVIAAGVKLVTAKEYEHDFYMKECGERCDDHFSQFLRYSSDDWHIDDLKQFDVSRLKIYSAIKDGGYEYFTSFRGQFIREDLIFAVKLDLVFYVEWFLANTDFGLDLRFLMEVACHNNSYKVAKSLFDKGVDVTASNNLFIILACKFCDTKFVKLLIDEGANVHAFHDICITLSCRRGNLEMTKLLFECGANIHSYGERTPDVDDYEEDELRNYVDSCFLEACEGGHMDIVKFLIQKGINLNDNIGFDHSCKSGNTDLVDYLLTFNPETRFALSWAAGCDTIEMILHLMDPKIGLKPNFDTKEELLSAISHNKPKSVNWFMDLGMDVDTNILKFAATYHARDCYSLLLRRFFRENLTEDLIDDPWTDKIVNYFRVEYMNNELDADVMENLKVFMK